MSIFRHEKTGPEKAAQRRSVAQQMSSPENDKKALQKMQRLVNDSPTMVAQRKLLNKVLQRDETAPLEDDELVKQTKQKDSAGTPAPGNLMVAQKKENNTGLPDNLKMGTESLSGIAMDDVRVHYGSSKPAQLNAHAYAQGTEIHVAPGQEQHLPHEAWHVVQQKQGRVEPTLTVDDVSINDDAVLEHEADVMGAKALSTGI
jgi:hypothetical protein